MPATVLSLIPEKVNVRVMQGTDNVVQFELLKGDGSAVDLTAHAVKFTAKTDFGGTTKIGTKTNAAGTHANALLGKTIFNISKADTTTLTPAEEVTWYYEVRLVEGGGQESVYVYGELVLFPAVGTSA